LSPFNYQITFVCSLSSFVSGNPIARSKINVKAINPNTIPIINSFLAATSFNEPHAKPIAKNPSTDNTNGTILISLFILFNFRLEYKSMHKKVIKQMNPKFLYVCCECNVKLYQYICPI